MHLQINQEKYKIYEPVTKKGCAGGSTLDAD
jgi:hypothetical protein